MPSQMRVPVLVHTPTEFRFKFDFDTSQGRHAGYFEPGKQTPSERIEDAEWPELLAVVSAWVEYVRREYEAPDLWRDLQLERQVVSGMAPAENTPFAPSEQAQIIEQLRELREFVRSSYQAESVLAEAL